MLDDVYYARVLRGSEFYLARKLGTYGTDLSLLANFFETPWTQPAATLPLDDQARVKGVAGFDLRALGRLAEAERLINETGYHRRDPELAALRAKRT